MFTLNRTMVIILLIFFSLKGKSIYEINEVKSQIEIPPTTKDFNFTSVKLSKILKPEFKNKNEIILRRKFDYDEYQFYKGTVRSTYMSELIKFMPEDSIEILLDKKFYKRPNDNPDNDILNVYFSNSSIFVENCAKLYYYENGWQKIDLYREDSAPITLLTYPDSVTVFINGINRGVTPLILKNLSPGFKVVNFNKDGYYSYEILFEKKIDIPELKRVVMQKMPNTPIGTYIDPETYSSGSEESLYFLLNSLENTRNEYIHLNERIDFAEKQYLDNYPSNEIRGEFENVYSFERRKRLYEKIKEAGLSNLNKDLLTDLYDLEEKNLFLSTYLEKLKRKEYYRFFSSENIELGNYDINKEIFPITIEINEWGHNFTFQGELSIPYSKALTFKSSIKESLLKLTYKSVISYNKNIEEQLLKYEYSNYSLLYKGGEYKILGELKLRIENNNLPPTVLKRDNYE